MDPTPLHKRNGAWRDPRETKPARIKALQSLISTSLQPPISPFPSGVSLSPSLLLALQIDEMIDMSVTVTKGSDSES